MVYKAVSAAAFLAVAASPSFAQDVGGSLGIEVRSDADFSDDAGNTYFGAIEYGINRQFSVAADASSYSFGNVGLDTTSFTVHGIYHLSETASVGLFVGQDNAATDYMVYGLEGGTEFMGGSVEGYVALLDGDADNGTAVGVDGAYGFNDQISFIGGFGFATSDASDASRLSIGAEYEISNGPGLYAEIGQSTVGGNSENFIGLGARIDFGVSRGTTFSPRSQFEISSGF